MLRAIFFGHGGAFIEPIDELWAVDVQRIELADQIGEDVGAFSI
jgi:hypothetical protein